MVVLFLLGVSLLLYALRSIKTERVCAPPWASQPAGTHLSIAIVTFSNEALQNKKREKKEEVHVRAQSINLISQAFILIAESRFDCTTTGFGYCGSRVL